MIRPANRTDVPVILDLIRALSVYEKLENDVVIRGVDLAEHLFGPRPYAECLLAEDGGIVVGFALFFHNYSTFRGKPGIYLEDLFVKPEYRGRGFGHQLFVELAKLAVARDCARLEWAVLDWNAPAISFYERLGAAPHTGWTSYRLTGDALRELATPKE